MTTTESPTLAALARLSSAEDIFAHLGLTPEPGLLNVSRLHILKRFGAYLKETELAGLPEEAVIEACRAALLRAQGDFIASTPLKEKVFKVFETQAAKQKAKFVGLDTIKIAKP